MTEPTAGCTVISVAPPSAERLASIDVVRGLAMVLMALDHARTYLSDFSLDPLDLQRTTLALFLTRWATHFSAPAFFFLAGVSARRLSLTLAPPDLTRFLLLRGCWLIVLELTLVYFVWTFKLPGTGPPILGVIWALGWSMVALAGFVRLPLAWAGAISVAVIAGHHVMDSIAAAALGPWSTAWSVLHEKGLTPVGKVVYPLVPWIAVMALGYVFGGAYDWAPPRRRLFFQRLGLGLIALFLALRLTGVYGDPQPWTLHPTMVLTVLSFLNVQKYPPSLAFLALTLGLALLALAVAERPRARLGRALQTFGRVPLFFYVAHLLLAHLFAGVVAVSLGFDLALLAKDPIAAGWGFGLPVAYTAWLSIVVLLYPACRRFADVKRRRAGSWLQYC